MFVQLKAAALLGIEARPVTVEVDIGIGSKYYMVGLPDSAVRESWQRIETAIRHHGYRMPRQRIVVNLSPANLRKEGTAYDLCIATGILAASEQVPVEALRGVAVMGELGLDGHLQPIKGALPIACCVAENRLERLVVPEANAAEAALVDGLEVIGLEHLGELIAWLRGTELELIRSRRTPAAVRMPLLPSEVPPAAELPDLRDVRGQGHALRALEIGAAGGHNLLFVGPPGSGKTMMARRLPGILPPMRMEEALETTKIHSVAGRSNGRTGLEELRPFRMPHHTVSHVAMVGGGNSPQPGEISLAHNGVLYLDELPEYPRGVLEVLRQPLESGFIPIARARYSVEYPARFMLVASMNPCPCGYHGHPDRECVCPPGAVQRYLARVSGPLLDRIDMHVEVGPIKLEELQGAPAGPTSAQVRSRVIAARECQELRYKAVSGIYANAQLPSGLLRQVCALPTAGTALLRKAMERLGLSARAHDRILKLSRTIADLEGSDAIKAEHLAEAIQYRSLDRLGWAA